MSGSAPPPWWRSPQVVRWLAIIVLSGAVLRVAAMLELSGLPYFTRPLVDAAIYERGASRIAGGDLLLADQLAGMSPGYFYVLGGLYSVLGEGPWAIRWLQVLLGLATVVVVFDAATRVVGSRWALAAAALAACFTPAIFFEQQTLGEALALFFHACALDGILAMREKPRSRTAALLGAAIGAAALLRPTGLALIAPALASTARASKGRARALGIAALLGLAAAVIAPITARNALLGEPVLISSHGGVNLWVGNGPGATGTFRVPAEVPGADAPISQFSAFREVASRESGRTLTVTETDRYWTRRTLASIATRPGEWLALMARKLRLSWSRSEISDVYRYGFLYQWSAVLRWLPRFGTLAALAIAGLVLALRRPGPRLASWVVAIAALECALVVAVFVSERYRLSTAAPLFVLAAVGMQRAWEASRARDRGGVFGVIAAVALGVALTWPVRMRDTRAMAWRELAESYDAIGDVESAAQARVRASSLEPR